MSALALLLDGVSQTGRATGEHLHFNVLTPVAHQDIFQSVPIEFTKQHLGHELKENDIVEK